MAENIIVFPYFQRGTESEAVHVYSECTLKTHDSLASFGVNPILTDFNKGGSCLHTLEHGSNHKEHADYLIALLSRDYVEIGFIADNALSGVLDFNPSATFGA